MNNLHTFVVEKKAQRKRRMFNLKYNVKSYNTILSHTCSKSPKLSLSIACPSVDSMDDSILAKALSKTPPQWRKWLNLALHLE
jgi:hypothetical protein